MLGPEPITLLDVDVEQDVPEIGASSHNGRRHRRARSIAWLHGRPLGMVDLTIGDQGLSAQDHAAHLWRALGTRIQAHLAGDGLDSVSALPAAGIGSGGVPQCEQVLLALKARAPFLSVVVATKDRPLNLARCLSTLLEVDYPGFEVVVVDNAPGSGATRRLVRERFAGHPQVRYVREDRPGLAAAHNRGLEESRGSLVAFTDDDVAVHRLWLLELARCFELGEEVGCVTGVILPAQLETPAQVWAESYWGLGKGFSEQRFDLARHRPRSPLFPFTAGVFGSGANMAFRTDVLRELGGFDPATGTGTAARGGDDLAAFFRLISAGYQLIYSPGAIVRHWHARDYPALRRQAYGYGVGLTAYLTKIALDEPARIPALAARAPRGIARALRHRGASVAGRRDIPAELKRLERMGMLHGPVAYIRSRRATRRWSIPTR